MKKIVICLFLFLFSIILVACSDEAPSGSKKDKKKNDSQIMEQLQELSQEAVKINVIEIKDEGYYKGTAEVTVSIPNYTELFLAAMDKKDPMSAVISALKGKQYEETEFSAEVPVTFDGNGVETIHSEAFVAELLEQELIKALNTIYKEEAT